MKLYHGTSVNNVESILKTGLHGSVFEQAVYLTDSAESAARWIGFRLAAIGEPELAVIEVDVNEDTLSPGVDHSPAMQAIFGCGESLLHEGDIAPDKITQVLYFKRNE